MRRAAVAIFLWRSPLRQGTSRIIDPPALAIHQRAISSEARKYVSPAPMDGWARKFAPKGVEGENWRRKPVKKKKARNLFSPYTIKAKRYFRKKMCLERMEELKRRTREEAMKEAARRAAREAARRERNGSNEHEDADMGSSKMGFSPASNGTATALEPVSAASSIPSYCKPVVKRIDPWRAPWTQPFKKPRENYQVGGPRAISKKEARTIRSSQMAAKAYKEEKMRRLARGKRVDPKQRMSYT